MTQPPSAVPGAVRRPGRRACRVENVLLVSRRLLQRRTRVATSARRLPVLLAVLCALLTPVLLTSFGGDPVTVNSAVVGANGPGLFMTVVASAVTAAASIAAIGWALLAQRRRANA